MQRKVGAWAAAVIACVAFVGSDTPAAEAVPRPASQNVQRLAAAGEEFPGREGLKPQDPAPLSREEIRRLLDEDASKPRFDGIVNGWRLAPLSVLEAEGIADRNLVLSCEPKPAGEETPTSLDFTIGYLPTGLKVTEASSVSKWICGEEGLSVEEAYTLETPLGSGDLSIYRAIWASRAFGAAAPDGSVEAGTINGKPAIFIHPADDGSGLGYGRVIVIEDDAEPDFTILHVSADNGVPFAELVKIAEGIR